MKNEGRKRIDEVTRLDGWLRDWLEAREDWLGTNVGEVGDELYNGQEASAWASGGCAILAVAINEWLGEESEIVVFNDAQGPMHVAVVVNGLLLDGYGVSRLERRLEEMAEYSESTSNLEDWVDGEPPEVWAAGFEEKRMVEYGIALDHVLSKRLADELGQIDARKALGMREEEIAEIG